MPRKIKNISDQRFGRLKVGRYIGVDYCGKSKISLWECKCDCGNLCQISHHNLMRGSTKSCGCLRKEKASKNLIGKKFGKLIVIKKDGVKKRKNSKDKSIVWKCLCICGKHHYVTTNLLCNGHVTSCGCAKKRCNIKDLSGKVFGNITVIEFFECKNNRTFWLCKCSCGNQKPIDGHHLSSGNQKSCGCKMGGVKHGYTKDMKRYRKYLRECPERRLRQNMGNIIRKALLIRDASKSRSSLKKHLPYSIEQLKNHLQSLWESWMNWDNYGGKSSEPRRTWWIDHIIPHSKFNYTSMSDPLFIECWALSNLRPLEKKANIRKGNKLSNND